MSDTVLGHPLVRDYLRALDAACAALPAGQARELHEQIAGHLDEALPGGAADGEVRAELERLGTPQALAAAAQGPGRPSLGRRLGRRLSRVRWWAWAATGAVTAAAVSGVTLVLLMGNAQPLQQGAMSAWYYPQDADRSVTTTAGDVTQLTVPERYGQQQGFLISIDNGSDWTQTIVGAGQHWAPFSYAPLQISVGSGPDADLGGAGRQVRWSSPARIPPHSVRLLRVLWTSDWCAAPDGDISAPDMVLSVDVGIVTRDEDIPLHVTWALAGDKESACH